MRDSHLGKAWGQGIITGTVLGLEVLGISCYFGHGGRRFVVSIFLRPFLADGWKKNNMRHEDRCGECIFIYGSKPKAKSL